MTYPKRTGLGSQHSRNAILISAFARSGQTKKPHLPFCGQWGLAYVQYRAFVSHASSISEGFRIKKRYTHQGQKLREHNTQMSRKKQAEEGDSRLRLELRRAKEPQSRGYRILDFGFRTLDAGQTGGARTAPHRAISSANNPAKVLRSKTASKS
jgi:hypothetical protein